MKTVLTIAGSDSSGGAGLQADLKVFSAHGLHGASVVTCVTAQNTMDVSHVFPLPREVIDAQLDAVFDDLDVTAIKSGVLGSVGAVEVVAAHLERHPLPYVLDPVAIASSGSALGSAAVVEACAVLLFPLATLITPNALEAAALTGTQVRDRRDAETAGRALLASGGRAVLVKGGHLEDDLGTDVLVTPEGVRVYPGGRIAAIHAHGTGCVLASAIAARLALGWPLADAVSEAREYARRAIRGGYSIGEGAGPVDPLFFLRSGHRDAAVAAQLQSEYSA